jgi:hypothetical protein
VLRAISRPHGEKAMIGVLQGAAAPHGNQPGVSDLAENHLSTSLCAVCPTTSCVLFLKYPAFPLS